MLWSIVVMHLALSFKLVLDKLVSIFKERLSFFLSSYKAVSLYDLVDLTVVGRRLEGDARVSLESRSVLWLSLSPPGDTTDLVLTLMSAFANLLSSTL
jgi:hypothetical protein